MRKAARPFACLYSLSEGEEGERGRGEGGEKKNFLCRILVLNERRN